MDIYQLQQFFTEMYPGKEIKYEFDQNCYRTNELIFTEGKPNCVHHIECNKVKATVQGMEPRYVPIMPHRLTVAWTDIKRLLSNCHDIYIHPSDIEELKKLRTEKSDLYFQKIQSLINISGLSKSQIENKL